MTVTDFIVCEDAVQRADGHWDIRRPLGNRVAPGPRALTAVGHLRGREGEEATVGVSVHHGEHVFTGMPELVPVFVDATGAATLVFTFPRLEFTVRGSYLVVLAIDGRLQAHKWFVVRDEIATR